MKSYACNDYGNVSDILYLLTASVYIKTSVNVHTSYNKS